MRCEHYRCVYWRDDVCILDEVSLNDIGLCEECICVTIPDEVLEQARSKLLRELEERHRKWEKG